MPTQARFTRVRQARPPPTCVMLSTWLGVMPVKLNMPIWEVMKDQSFSGMRPSSAVRSSPRTCIPGSSMASRASEAAVGRQGHAVPWQGDQLCRPAGRAASQAWHSDRCFALLLPGAGA